MVTVAEMADGIADMMEARLGVGGRGLEAKLKRAGRRLPRSVRRDARMITEALPMEHSAKLQKRIDLARLEVAERRVMAHLRTIDPKERRIDAALGMLGSIAFSLIVVFGLLVGVLVWRGFL